MQSTGYSTSDHCCCCSVAKSCPPLRPNGLQHARLLCPLLSPGVCSNSHLLSWWCSLTISSSPTPFSLCLQSFPNSGSFSMSQLFTSDLFNSITSKKMTSFNHFLWSGLFSITLWTIHIKCKLEKKTYFFISMTRESYWRRTINIRKIKLDLWDMNSLKRKVEGNSPVYKNLYIIFKTKQVVFSVLKIKCVLFCFRFTSLQYLKT